MQSRIGSLLFALAALLCHCSSLSASPAPDKRTRALIEAMSEGHALDRAYVISEIGELESRGSVAVPALMQACSDPAAVIRVCASSALGKIKKKSKLCMPVLIELLGDENQAVASEASVALGAFGRLGVKPCLDAIEEPKLRAHALRALAIIGKPARRDLEALFDVDGCRPLVLSAWAYSKPPAYASILRGFEQAALAEATLIALGTAGVHEAMEREQLTEFLEDVPQAQRPVVRFLVSGSRFDLRTTEAEALALVQHEVVDVRKRAVIALGQWRTSSGWRLGVLGTCLHDEQVDVVLRAMASIQAVLSGTAVSDAAFAERADPIRQMKEEFFELRKRNKSAAWTNAVVRMGTLKRVKVPAAPKQVPFALEGQLPTIEAMLSADDPRLVAAALWLLEYTRPRNEAARDLVLPFLNHEHPLVLQAALESALNSSMRGTGGWSDQVRPLTKHADQRVAWMAAYTTLKEPRLDTRDLVIEYLQSENDAVRTVAAVELKHRGDMRAAVYLEALVFAFRAGNPAATGLLLNSKKEGAQAFYAALEDDSSSPVVLGLALLGLMKTGLPPSGSLELIEELVDHPHGDVAGVAERALEKLEE